MILGEALEIHAVSSPECGGVCVTIRRVEGFVFGANHDLRVVSTEEIVEPCIDTVV